MTTINLYQQVGFFAENKDIAAKLRKETILPTLNSGSSIEIDFSGITLATQSFIHALISDVLRQHGEDVLSRLKFRNCEKAVRGIVEIVVQYVLETIEDQVPTQSNAA